MDAQERKTGKVIAYAIEDLKSVQGRLEAINKETCTDKTLHIIDEACDSIDMAIRFLNHIDMNDFGTNRNGEGIKLNTTYRRTKQQN